jgi:hypothetical protein
MLSSVKLVMMVATNRKVWRACSRAESHISSSGPIPPEIGQLAQLTLLTLSNNQAAGAY